VQGTATRLQTATLFKKAIAFLNNVAVLTLISDLYKSTLQCLAMDVISHGLWGSLAFGRKNKKSFWLAFLLGMLPDLLSFGIYFIAVFLKFNPAPSFHMEPPQDNFIPQYVHVLYAISHSIIIFAILFGLLWFIFKRPVYEFLAWGLHILFDIPTHSYAFFPTPFLWPLSGFQINGIPWSHAIIMIPDIILLVALYTWFFLIRPWLRKKNLPTQNIS